MTELPVWRSILYVPVNVERYVEKAHLRGADCIQLDLEDSVPASEKERARGLVAQAAPLVARGGADVIVRINRPLRLAVRDLEAVISKAVRGVSLAKVESASHVRLLDEVVTELEAERGLAAGHTRFVAMIETPAAFFQIEDIARASPRVVALEMGGEDFALNTGAEPAADVFLYPKQQIVLAANAAGILPLGFLDTIASFGDREAFRAMVRRSRRFGFLGASCIHPDQVTILNEEYRPAAAEVDYARRVIEANDAHAATGRGSFQIDGKMIDIPVVERARRVLARDAVIREREARAARLLTDP
jgi:citrate lyase subunit beta/citryl-CoA lyase